MTRFDKAQIIRFLHSLDRNLKATVQATVLGGAAACVGYDSGTMTANIDVFSFKGSQDAFLRAADLARKETGLGVGVGPAAVADLPENYAERLKSIRGLNLKDLRILIPDKYDLTLSKAVRGHPHDIDSIAGMHDSHRLSHAKLVDRFEKELRGTAVANDRKLNLNMAMVISRLFGFEQGKKFATRWNVPIPTARKFRT